MKPKVIVSLVLGIAILIIIIQNVRDVQTDILFWTISLPHIFLLFIVFAIGIIIGMMLPGLMTKKPEAEKQN
ncbi:MAG: LapA family protein [Ignavibacterium sp.]|nr:LapA family protein [Ignavibacterium sp.]MBS4034875.1 LapA family protein [Ignavibacterium sp.]